MPQNRHKGLRELSGDEATGLSLGQAGFNILSGGGGGQSTLASSKGVRYWIGLKAVGGDAVISARQVEFIGGDDFSQTGVWGGTNISLSDGDIIYGAFDAVNVNAGDFVLAYRGKTPDN